MDRDRRFVFVEFFVCSAYAEYAEHKASKGSLRPLKKV